MMNPPMTRNKVELENAPKTKAVASWVLSGSRVGICSTTHRAMASKEVIGIGSASVTHMMMTNTITAARACWLASKGRGSNSISTNAAGPANRPMVLRMRSNRLPPASWSSISASSAGGAGTGGAVGVVVIGGLLRAGTRIV